jgi:signal peptide peptidase SppA
MKCLISGLCGQEPLLIDPIKAANHMKYAEKYGVVDGVLDMFFNPQQKPYVTAMGTAVIPVSGSLGLGLTKFEKLTGGVDMADVGNSIDEMLANPAVKRIAFQVNSPGGTVLGTPELADKVYNIQLPTMTYARELIASGAYYAFSQVRELVAAPSAYVGSIGVIMVDESYADYYNQIGLKMEIFRAGKYKAANVGGEGYTDEMRAMEQERIDAMHEQFKQTVLRTRSFADRADMEGQVYPGAVAAEKNLVTGLANTFEDALAMFEGSDVKSVKRAVVASQKSGKKAQAIIKHKASELEDEVLDLLTPRQKEMVDGYVEVEELFGAFDQGIGPDGAHYVAASPFAAEGLLCQNCVFYRGPRGCGIVSGDIDPNGICKLWVIPQ